MCTSLSNVNQALIDNATETVPVNGTPPGLTEKPPLPPPVNNGTGIVAKKTAVPVPKMGNQQGTDGAKSTSSSKKKGQSKKSSKQSSASSSPRGDDSLRKSKTSPKKAKASSSPSTTDSPKQASQHGACQPSRSEQEDSVPQGEPTTVAYSDASEKHVQSTTSAGDKHKAGESSSGDNTSFESVGCATPQLTPNVTRNKPLAEIIEPSDRVDALGKSIQQTIIERFSDTSQATGSAELQGASTSIKTPDNGVLYKGKEQDFVVSNVNQPACASGDITSQRVSTETVGRHEPCFKTCETSERHLQTNTEIVSANFKDTELSLENKSAKKDDTEDIATQEHFVSPGMRGSIPQDISDAGNTGPVDVLLSNDVKYATGDQNVGGVSSAVTDDCTAKEILDSGVENSLTCPEFQLSTVSPEHVSEHCEKTESISDKDTSPEKVDSDWEEVNGTEIENTPLFITEPDISPGPEPSTVVEEPNITPPTQTVIIDEQPDISCAPQPNSIVDEPSISRAPQPTTIDKDPGIPPPSQPSTANEEAVISSAPQPSTIVENQDIPNAPQPNTIDKEPDISRNPQPCTAVEHQDISHALQPSAVNEGLDLSHTHQPSAAVEETSISYAPQPSTVDKEPDIVHAPQPRTVGGEPDILRTPQPSAAVEQPDILPAPQPCTVDEYVASDNSSENEQLSAQSTIENPVSILERDVLRTNVPIKTKTSQRWPAKAITDRSDDLELNHEPGNEMHESKVCDSGQNTSDIQGRSSVEEDRNEKRDSSVNSPLMDSLLQLIKETMESDNSEGQEIPNNKSCVELTGNQTCQETVTSQHYSANEDIEKTLTPEDMAEFERLKSEAFPVDESYQVEEADDDTLTQAGMNEFDRLKKAAMGEGSSEYALVTEDKFDLSSGETTEDSVIERPVRTQPALVTAQDVVDESNAIHGANVQTPPDALDSSDIPETKADDDQPSAELRDSVFEDPPPPKQRSLTEDEIRREIRKFMIPEMQEALPIGGTMNRMLDDLHSITPTSENYPGFDEKEASPDGDDGSGHRSRTSITSSELDISEHRDDVSTDSMYADDEDDSSSEVLFCKTYTEPERGTEVLLSCTVVNSGLKQETSSSDEFWADNSAAEDAYREVEFAAKAVNQHFTHARTQMQDIQHHLQALKYQMQDMEQQVVRTTLPSTDEFGFDDPERRAITD